MSDYANALLRHGLELALILPGAAFCFLPCLPFLRRRRWLVFLVSAVTLLAFIGGGAFYCARVRLPSYLLLLAALPLFFPLFLWATDLDWRKLFFCFAEAAMFCAFCILYTNLLVAPWEENTTVTFLPRHSLICLGLGFVLVALFFRTLTQRLPYMFGVESLDQVWALLALLPLLVTFILWWLIPDDIRILLVGRLRLLGLVLFPGLPAAMVGLHRLLFQIAQGIVERTRQRKENTLLRMEQKRYEELRGYMAATRTLRHDFRQHLLVLSELARSGRTEELNAYMNQLKLPVSESHSLYCANTAVDAVAAHYAHLAEEQSITLDWILELPETLPLPEAEFCAMLGNLLENAMTAVSALPPEQRHVTAISRMLSDAILGLSVENPFTGRIRLGPDGLPISRGKGHGIGLASVAASVRRHHGSLQLQTAGHVFAVNILLYF